MESLNDRDLSCEVEVRQQDMLLAGAEPKAAHWQLTTAEMEQDLSALEHSIVAGNQRKRARDAAEERRLVEQLRSFFVPFDSN